MQNVQAGADYSGSKLLGRPPQTGDMMFLADLTGGVEAVAREPLYGEVAELSSAGAPIYKRQGVIVDASNYLGTTLDPDDFDERNLTLAGVFYRSATSMYLGNFDNGATCDALLESSTLDTRFRYRSATVNTNVDVVHPCPAGAPFFFAASCTTSDVTAFVGYLGRHYTTVETDNRDVGGTLAYRIGQGPGTGFTDSPFLACGAAMWNRALTVNDLAEVYAWFRHRHALIGVHY
jgi:hypothetical protein